MIEFQQVGHFDVADDLGLAARITDVLAKHYPGYLWGVLFNEDGGVLHIINETVQDPIRTNRLYAYTLRIDRCKADPDLKCIVRAGGEYLERANLSRNRYTGDVPVYIDGVPERFQPK